MLNFKKEKKLWRKGYKYIIGLDEVGRGALAGPVVAAAVMIKKFSISGIKKNVNLIKDKKDFQQFSTIKDSKKLTVKKREEFYKNIISHQNIKWGIGIVSEKIIDKINILEATKLAMKKAVNELIFKNFIQCSLNKKFLTNKKNLISKTFLILDGKINLNLPISQEGIIKGDEKVFSCAVASIIAKVTRDRIMEKFAKKFFNYGFEKHKGYLTKFHLKMLKKFKRCVIHRYSFYYGSTKAKTY